MRRPGRPWRQDSIPVGTHMSGIQVVELLDLFDELGVRCWVMGGWGVDVLLGCVSREHKDVDLLVHVSSLPVYSSAAEELGFVRKLAWSENRPLVLGSSAFDSAFVDAHPDGREIDVHVVDTDEFVRVIPLHDDPWPLLDGALAGMGRIEGRRVRCVSRAAQRAMHSNYHLPKKHQQDMRMLEGLADFKDIDL